MPKIDEKTNIPLGVVAAALVIIVPAIMKATNKIDTIDTRLNRIETKLGIKNEGASAEEPLVIPEARAEEKDDDRKQRPSRVQDVTYPPGLPRGRHLQSTP